MLQFYRHVLPVLVPKFLEQQIWTLTLNETRNAMRRNNREDFLHLSFTLKTSIFLYISQSKIYDGGYIAKI